MNKDQPAAVLDACGLKCPEPVMLVHKAIRPLAVGDLLEVRATDPSTRRDISRFCEFLHHQLLELREEGETLVFLIRKGEKKRPAEGSAS